MVKKHLKKFFRVTALIFFVIFFVFALKHSSAWVEPTDFNNFLTFLNSGPFPQVKLGGLALNLSGAPVGLVVEKGLVGVGTTNPEGVLDLTSANSGLLPPRMTTAERNSISSPQLGMIIVNSETKKINIFNGLIWEVAGEGSPVESNIVYSGGDGGEGNSFCKRGTISNDGRQGAWTNINEGLSCGLNKKCANGSCISF